MSEIKQYKVTEPWLDLSCELGEAPFWEEYSNTLRFVDIVKQEVHTVDMAVGPSSHKIKKLDISIGTTADIKGTNDHFVFGGKAGYGIYNKKTQSYKYIKKFWTDSKETETKERTLRANDGSVDAKGRYWCGTMNDPKEKEPTNEGVLFRLDPDLTLHTVLEGVTIPNGMSWSLDNKTMFFTDSPEQAIFKYDFDEAKGKMSNKRKFFDTSVYGKECVPDGHAVDAESHLWVAVHGGGRVVRVNPEGKVVAEVLLPTQSPSCPGFVGEDLIITSEKQFGKKEKPDATEAELKAQGAVFKCHVGIKGAPLNRFVYNGEL